MALKMLTLYLAAKDYLVEEGVPRDLLEIAAKRFGSIKGKPLTARLLESVLFAAAPWHIRAARAFKLLLEEFANGKNILSYGCGSAIIEILALVASNNTAKLTLIDIDPVGIELTEKLLALLHENGYDVRDQVFASVGNIHNHKLPTDVDTVVSIGLLHNYFPMDTANALMEKWFAAGARKVISDIYYDPENIKGNDAELRVQFVKNVLNWKFGPPDGLCFCEWEDLCDSLPDRNIDVYDHGLNATVIVS